MCKYCQMEDTIEELTEALANSEKAHDLCLERSEEFLTRAEKAEAEVRLLREQAARDKKAIEGTYVVQRNLTAEVERLMEVAESDWIAFSLAVRALLAVEWVEMNDGVNAWSECPWCFEHEAQGHAPDCTRQSALRGGG